MKVAVVGASLGGLATANVFHQLGASVRVFEKFAGRFSNRGNGLGFVDVDLWQELRGERMTRRGRQASRAQGSFYYGDLWDFLFGGLPAGTVTFDHAVESLGDDLMRPAIDGESYDLVVLADGGWSKLRRYVTNSMPEYAGYVGWRGQVNAEHVPAFDSFGLYKSGIFDTIMLPCPTNDGRDLINAGFVVATPADEVTRPAAGASRHFDGAKKGTPDWLLKLYRQQFGTHAGGELVRLFEAFAKHGSITPHPQYDYAAEKVNAGRVLLVGDAAHMASPRTAAGAHTAVLDAMALREAFTAHTDVDAALRTYSRDALTRAKELNARSRAVARQFLPAGGLAAVQSPSKLVAG